MTVHIDTAITAGVYHVTMTIVSGKVRHVVATTYNPAQGEFCIRRTLRRLKMDRADIVTIEIKNP